MSSLFQPPLRIRRLQKFELPEQDFDPENIKKQEKAIPYLQFCRVGQGLFNDIDLKLNPDKVGQVLEKEYYDATKIDHLRCALQSVFAPSVGYQSVLERVKRWLRNPRLLQPEENMSADIYRADFLWLDDLMTIRVPFDHESAVHELFVATLMNQLRTRIPNFNVILGSFDCSFPVKESLCVTSDSKVQVQYLLYETISPGVSFGEYLTQKDVSLKDVISILLQVAFSLREAQSIGFSHNNLLVSNVMVRKNETDKKWLMYGKKDPEYLYAENIATIINYETSSIKYLDQVFGYQNRPIQPVRDLITLWASAVENSPKTIAGELEKIMPSFFIDYKKGISFKELLDQGVPLPDEGGFKKYPDLNQIIDLIDETYTQILDQILADEPEGLIMSCRSDGICTTFDQGFSFFGLDKIGGPFDLFGLYDAVVAYQEISPPNQDEISQAIENFPRKKAREEFDRQRARLKSIKKDIENFEFRPVEILKPTPELIIDSLKKSTRFLKQIAEYSDLLNENQILKQVLFVTAQVIDLEFDPLEYEPENLFSLESFREQGLVLARDILEADFSSIELDPETESALNELFDLAVFVESI